MKRLGILCPGQGNQHPAMFDKLSGNPAADSVLRSAAAVFGCHPVEYLQKLPAAELFRNRAAQLLIGTLQVATWTALREMLPPPSVFAGYSMGELAAYGCAGALSIDEALMLMEKRALLMDEATFQPSGLLAIRGLGREQIDSLCRSAGVAIAIINGPDHFIIGGTEDALRQCEINPLANKASSLKQLQVAVPSHTSLLSEASRLFERVLKASSLSDPLQPLLAGVSGSVVHSREQAITALAQQISNPINWLTCMQTAVELGCNVFLELGPGNALAKMLQDIFPEISVRSVEEFRSLQGAAAWVEKQCL